MKNSKQESGGGQVMSLTQAAKTLQVLGAAAAVLQVQDLQAYWLSIMSDPAVSAKDRLSASKLYAQSIGALEKKNTAAGGASGYRYSWKHTINTTAEDPEKAQ